MVSLWRSNECNSVGGTQVYLLKLFNIKRLQWRSILRANSTKITKRAQVSVASVMTRSNNENDRWPEIANNNKTMLDVPSIVQTILQSFLDNNEQQSIQSTLKRTSVKCRGGANLLITTKLTKYSWFSRDDNKSRAIEKTVPVNYPFATSAYKLKAKRSVD